MCIVSVKIDEAMLRDVLPELDSPAAISRWAQLLIDQHIDALAREYAHQQTMIPEELYNGLAPDDLTTVRAIDDDECIDLETMRENLHKMVREVYAQP